MFHASIWFPKEHCSYEIVFDRSLFSSPKKLISYEMCYPGLAKLTCFIWNVLSWVGKTVFFIWNVFLVGKTSRCFIWNVLSWVGKTDLFHMKCVILGWQNWFFSYEMFSWLAKLADVSYEMCYPGYASRCFIWTVWGNSYEFKLRFGVIHMKRMFHMKGLG